MLSLRKLADTEPNRLLYIERFQLNKTIPETLIMTVKIIFVIKEYGGIVMSFLLLKSVLLRLAF